MKMAIICGSMVMNFQHLGGRFRYFLFFLLVGGEGEVQGDGRGGRGLLKIPRGGGVSHEGGG